MSPLRSLSIRHGLLFALAGGPILLVLAFALALDRFMDDLVRRQVQDAFRAVALQMADGVDRELFLHYRDVRMPARVMSRNIPAGEPLEVTAVGLQVVLDSNPAFQRAYLVNPWGQVMVSTDPALAGRNFSNTPWFRTLVQEHGAPGFPEHTFLDIDASGNSRVVLAAPLVGEVGDLFALMAVEMDWTWLENLRGELLRLLSQNSVADFLILDSNGEVLLDSPRVSEERVAEAVRLWRRSGSSVTDAVSPAGHHLSPLTELEGSDGRTYLATMADTKGYRDVPGLGWVVLFLKDAEVVYGPARRAQVLVVGAGLLVILGTALLGWWVASALVRPLGELSRAAQLIWRGAPDVSFPRIERFVELRSLSLSLRMLLQRLRRREHELEEMNLSLEERVRERTSEIDMVNGALMNEIEAREALELERNRLIEDLRRQATHDSMTGVLNRRALMQELDHAFNVARRHERPLSLLMVDIDHFKLVNDSLGHDAGDEAIVALARTCQQHCREIDFVARFGGEEFIILLPDTDAEQAAGLAERLRAAVEDRPVKLSNGRSVPMTISVGVAQYKAGDDIASLLKRADEALYQAKRGGRNRVAA